MAEAVNIAFALGDSTRTRTTSTIRRTGIFLGDKIKLKEYDDLPSCDHVVLSLKRPSKAVHKAEFDFIWKEKAVKDEYQFVYHREDFGTLGQANDNWLGSALESVGRFIPRRILEASSPISLRIITFILTSFKWLLFTSHDKARTENDSSTYFCYDERAKTLLKAITGVAITILLILPIVVLYILTVHSTPGGVKISVLVIFTVAFTVAIATLTKASRQEVFGASAAYATQFFRAVGELIDADKYSAVLVVFIGNVPQT